MAESADQPLGVVGLDEASHGLAELVDAVVQFDPQTLLLEGADPALGAAVGLRLAQEGRVVGDPKPGDRAQKVARALLRSPVMAQLHAAGDIGIQPAPAVDDRVVDGLEASKAVPDLGHVRPRLGRVVIHHGKDPDPAVDPGPGHGGVGAPPPVGRLGDDRAVMGRGLRRPRARCGASRPARRSSRNTRLPLTWTPCSRPSRARTLRSPSPVNGEASSTWRISSSSSPSLIEVAGPGRIGCWA